MTYLSRHFSFVIAEFVMLHLSCCSSGAKRFLFLLPRMLGTFPFLLFSACASCCNEHKPFFPPHVGQWFVWYMTRSFKLKELEVLIEEKISRSHFNPDEARFSWHLSTFSFQATVIHSDVLLYFQFSVRILIIVIDF